MSPDQESISEDHTEVVDAAFKEIMQSMCGVSIEETASFDESILADGVIIAVISLIGAVEWSIFIGLPKETAEKMSEAFCGFPIPFESEDMGDAAGEVANIAAGTVKSNLHRKGVEADISLPNVLRASNLEVLVTGQSRARKTCYDSPFGKMWTGLVIGKSNEFVA